MGNPATVFSDQANKILAALSILISEHPQDVKALLEAHDLGLPGQPGVEELIGQVLHGIGLNDPVFQKDLAQLINYRLNPESHDSFSGVPMDPISAIAGAVGSIGNIFNQSQKNKLYQQEARTQTFSNLLAYQTMKKQLAAEQVARQQAQKKRIVLLQAGGLIVVTGIGLWFFLKR